MISALVLTIYFFILIILSLFGIHRYYILYLYYRHYKLKKKDIVEPGIENYPTVAIQLPIYNEKYVVERLIRTVARIRYPQDKLSIQVLDDSTDQTRAIARQTVEALQKEGFTISYIHRAVRTGYKAGALQAGLMQLDAELIALFDADFLPSEDFLEKTVGHFNDPSIAMVQTRWGYINKDYSLLTRIQAVLLDGHFVLEHTARCYSGRFFNFNGTAGIWRRSAILAAGSWQGDTLTEDLDLSYRAQLQGAKFKFLPDVICLSELPVDIEAFKRQQFRWAKGATQVARKLLPDIWRSSWSFPIKLEATVHLTSNFCYLLMVVFTLILPISIFLRSAIKGIGLEWLELLIFVFTILSISLFYIISQFELYRKWLVTVREIPFLFSLGIGMCLNNASAVIDAFRDRKTAFERTPKYKIEKNDDQWKGKAYTMKRKSLLIGEFYLFLYLLVFLFFLVVQQFWFSIPLFMLFLTGYALICSFTIQQIEK